MEPTIVPVDEHAEKEKAKQMSLEGGAPTIGEREWSIRKRDGRVVPFDEGRIRKAIEKAFRAVLGIPADAELALDVAESVSRIGENVVNAVLKDAEAGYELTVERIQDTVERELMAAGHYDVARSYIVYREERRKARALEKEGPGEVYVTKSDGSREILKRETIRGEVSLACAGFEGVCSGAEIGTEVEKMLYDGVTTEEISRALILAARSRIEKDPQYTYVAARLLLSVIDREMFGVTPLPKERSELHRRKFRSYLERGVDVGRLSGELLTFDTDTLARSLDVTRDETFTYLGLQTLYDRYFLRHEGRCFEAPQYFWMRVAMGLAVKETHDREKRAQEFYVILSTFRFVSSTPTLFNAGTNHPQLSSCYLLTVQDDLESIFKLIADNAMLSKWAGGLGNDWTSIRSIGSHIKGTNGKSQGVIPFLKVANDTLVAVNQGGKRKGAGCAYLETWHLDIEDFLELRKNTGDERRRTHDMNTANWIPDLFMKRVQQQSLWTLFDPSEVPDLHDLYGSAFEERYSVYEQMAEQGRIRNFKKVEAVALWRKMLSMVFETGHPWMTFKDPSNIRSPQDHVGVVHSSNLCTEILLNTSKDETAVCNLGSVNLAAHVREGSGVRGPAFAKATVGRQGSGEGREDFREAIDEEMLAATVRTAMRMLDNVIDINFYPTKEAENANKRHRPVGLGVMGFQDALYKLNVSYASEEGVAFADQSQEMISYYAILASTELSRERGTYSSYSGSKWSRGLLPIDTVDLLEAERGGNLDVDRGVSMDWSVVRAALEEHGMRNSNTMAIAPTATIANITGITQSIEPTYKNLYAKSNLSGDFTVINPYLVMDLKARGLWDDQMIDDLKYFDGSVLEIERIPDDLKRKYLTAFEIDQSWLIECASRRQKWIDMGQSFNLYAAEASGQRLHDVYFLSWRKGLKTTYYLRSLGATHIEKSTQDINRRAIQPRWMKSASPSSRVHVVRSEQKVPKVCSILDPECEACQ